MASHGKVENAVDIFKKVEKTNKMEVPTQVYLDFKKSMIKMSRGHKLLRRFNLLKAFTTRRVRKHLLALTIFWMLISVLFDGHVRAVDLLGPNLLLNFFLECITHCFATIILHFIMNTMGRRLLLFTSILLSSVFSIMAAIPPPTIHLTVMGIIARFFINIPSDIGLIYAGEMIPAVVKDQCIKFIHIMGNLSAIASPFIVYLSKYLPEIPFFILGMLGFCTCLIPLCLPETLDEALPLSLKDGRNFGKNQPFWKCPINKSNFDYKTVKNDFEPFTSIGNALMAHSKVIIQTSSRKVAVKESPNAPESEKIEYGIPPMYALGDSVSDSVVFDDADEDSQTEDS